MEQKSKKGIRMKTMVMSLLLVANGLCANIAPSGFEAFPNYYFVETGAYNGHGTRYAVRARFQEIHAVELLPQNVRRMMWMFRGFSNVHIHLGDSGKVLWNVIKEMDKPITFWLDAHSGEDNPHQKNTPIMEELEQIKWHPIKTHTILVDDMHCSGKIMFDGITKEQIAAKIMEINPEYVIRYVPRGNDGEYPENVMVAQVPQS